MMLDATRYFGKCFKVIWLSVSLVKACSLVVLSDHLLQLLPRCRVPCKSFAVADPAFLALRTAYGFKDGGISWQRRLSLTRGRLWEAVKGTLRLTLLGSVGRALRAGSWDGRLCGRKRLGNVRLLGGSWSRPGNMLSEFTLGCVLEITWRGLVLEWVGQERK